MIVKTASMALLIAAALWIVTLLYSCSAIHRPAHSSINPLSNPLPNPQTPIQHAISHGEMRITIMLAALQPAEIEYSSKVMKPEAAQAYVLAAAKYNQAYACLAAFKQTVLLHVKPDYAQHRFDEAMDEAELAVMNLSLIRGVKP